MTVDVTWEPRGRTFIPRVLGHPKFRSQGFLTGVSSKGYYYVVLNPRKRPFYVWKKSLPLTNPASSKAYEQTALSLGAAAFSNGPMMDMPTAGEVFKQLIIQIGFWTVVAAVGFALISLILTGGVSLPFVLQALQVGLGAGLLAAFVAILQNGCVPYKEVRGSKHGINDPGRGINGNLVWFGRGVSIDFPSFEVNGPGTGPPSSPGPAGPPPASLVEVSNGLIPLVIRFLPRTNVAGPNFNQGFANLESAMGSVAWALIPLDGTGAPPATGSDFGFDAGPLTPQDLQGVDLIMPGDSTPLSGVVMTIGQYSTAFNLESAGLLASIGTRDAVAMDGSNSVMLGSQSQLFPIYPAGSTGIGSVATGSPPFFKQYIQKYGFYMQ